MTQTEIDRLYDALAELVDATPKEERELVLARLAVTLAQRLDNYQSALEAISIARNSGSGS
jgi:hypothetical protein